ncbi:MAG TPA: zinc-binding dehydrogenase [Candidatus Binatia bacterium]|nr:zinc-binding dehydrogenase [Candidatus Binatia bacterium]
MIPPFMQGVQLVGHGGPEKLVWNERIPTPLPAPGRVLVRVLAAGVNNTDINTRIGWYSKSVSVGTQEIGEGLQIEAGGWSGALSFPLIQGGDLCGEVVALGDGVKNLRLGMRVTCPINQPVPTDIHPMRFVAIGSEYDGAFAQFCSIPADQLYDVSSSSLTDVEIAAIPCSHGTAINLLKRAGVRRGDKVLVTGASGGVGLAVVELATLFGAEVTAIASPHKQTAVRAAGAKSTLDRDARLEPGVFSAAIDVVGGPGIAQVLDSLAPGGRYAISGAIAGPIVQADLRTIYLNDLTIFGCTYTPRKVFAELIELVKQGKVRPLVSKTYPLRDIAKAQVDFAAKTYPGKLVLIPPPPS